MSSKLSIACLLLVACSGSAGAEIMSAPAGEPDQRVSVAPEGPSNPEAGPDASLDAATDAGTGVGQDAGEDASQPDSGGQDAAPTPRYGVTFSNAPGEAVTLQTPTDIAGKASLTLEAWFRLNSATDQGAIFKIPYAYCAYTTTGPTVNHVHCCDHQGASNTCVESSSVATIGAWHHVAWVLASGSWTLFLDGQKQGDVPSVYQTHPGVATNAGPNPFSHVYLGTDNVQLGSSVAGTIDEFRLSYSTLYAAGFAPPKHLDAPGAVNLMLDEGVGATSGGATIHGSAAWIAVSR